MRNAMIIAGLLASASVSHAQYAGPTIAPTTVNALLESGKNDQQVVLQGRIVRHNGGENYRFADSTGEMEIEIDAKNWPANTPIDANTEVRVHGEYEKELFGEAEIEVTQLELLKSALPADTAVK